MASSPTLTLVLALTLIVFTFSGEVLASRADVLVPVPVAKGTPYALADGTLLHAMDSKDGCVDLLRIFESRPIRLRILGDPYRGFLPPTEPREAAQ